MVSPGKEIGDAEPVTVIAPGSDVATYSVASGLPIYDGAVKRTLALESPGVAVPIVGAPGCLPPDEATIPLLGVIMLPNLLTQPTD